MSQEYPQVYWELRLLCFFTFLIYTGFWFHAIRRVYLATPNEYMRRRYPALLYVLLAGCMLITIRNTFISETAPFSFTLPIRQAFAYKKQDNVKFVLDMIAIYCFAGSILTRVWLLYFKLQYQSILSKEEWWNQIDPSHIKQNFYFAAQPTWG